SHRSLNFGSTEPHEFPNVSSATARLRAFSCGYRDSGLPNRRPSPKNAKSAGPLLSSFPADTLGGRVQKESYRTTRARAGPTTSHEMRRHDGFQSSRIRCFIGYRAQGKSAAQIPTVI